MELASSIQWLIPVAGLVAVAFAGYLARDVLRRDTGTDAMREVAGTIYEGAVAFIRRQYTTIAILALVGAVIIGIVITLIETADVADVPKLAGLPIGIMTAFAFIVGAACSMASGIIGMFVAVRSNVRGGGAKDAGRKSMPSRSVMPELVVRMDLGSTRVSQKGTAWKYVPLSPPGSSPSR